MARFYTRRDSALPRIDVGAAGVRILIVEDSPANQALGVAILSAAGHNVEIANDGHEALRAVAGGAYDMVLMDVGLNCLVAYVIWVMSKFKSRAYFLTTEK